MVRVLIYYDRQSINTVATNPDPHFVGGVTPASVAAFRTPIDVSATHVVSDKYYNFPKFNNNVG